MLLQIQPYHGFNASSPTACAARIRKTYSLEFKLQAIEYAKSHSQKETAMKFGIGISNVCIWLKMEDTLRVAEAYQGGTTTPGQQQLHASAIEGAFEKSLIKWFKETKAAGKCISKQTFGEMTEDIFRKTIRDNLSETTTATFQPGSTWIKGFIKKHNIWLEDFFP